MSKCDTCIHNGEPLSEFLCEKCRVKFEDEPFKMYEAREVIPLQRMSEKIIDILPEDLPWLPYLKQEGYEAEAWICLMLGMLALPEEKMKEIAQETLSEMKEAEDEQKQEIKRRLE